MNQINRLDQKSLAGREGKRESVSCIHCFRVIGNVPLTDSRKTPTHKHTCLEAQIARRPAAPPPFN